ncbi:MAG: DUF1684 domain-containing protein [Terracidiphilus sp.]|nr:DUF1684 domain-containing protein [Terracidiphilus sp.]
MRRAFLFPASALLLALLVAPLAAPAQSADAASWRTSLDAWRAQHDKEISAADGWLTLIGLEWLKPGVNTIGSAPDNTLHLPASTPAHVALLTITGKTPATATVQLLAPKGGFPAGLALDGHTPHEGTLKISDAHPAAITVGSLSLVVLARGDRFVLRIKDSGSPTRAAFHGLHWYAPDPAFRVTARWIPYRPARVESIATVIGTTLQLPAPGVAEFMLKGKVYLLEPVLEGGDKTHLFFILRDETSKTTTYGAGRFLLTGLPDHGLDQPGSLEIDFNRLYNPPCAYTPYATCPLPPEKNRLPVTIEAGEQRYASE